MYLFKYLKGDQNFTILFKLINCVLNNYFFFNPGMVLLETPLGLEEIFRFWIPYVSEDLSPFFFSASNFKRYSLLTSILNSFFSIP